MPKALSFGAALSRFSPRSALSRIPLGRALIALGLVLVGINVAAAIWDVRKAYERTERRALRDFSNMTRLLAEQTAASLDSVDLILRAVQSKTPAELVGDRAASCATSSRASRRSPRSRCSMRTDRCLRARATPRRSIPTCPNDRSYAAHRTARPTRCT